MLNSRDDQEPPAEKGVALIELALTAPVLVFLLIAMIDISRMLSTYMGLIQISREGARKAATEQGLEFGQYAFNVESQSPSCDGAPMNHATCILSSVYSLATGKVGTILFVDPQTIQVQLRFADPLYAIPAEDTDSVVFLASASYEGIFDMFTGAVISASAEAPRT